VISRRDRDFKKLFALLPAHVQEQAVKAFLLWQANPWHPSLDFKPHNAPYWSVRVSRDYRAVGARDGDTIIWTWIGTHGTYDKKF